MYISAITVVYAYIFWNDYYVNEFLILFAKYLEYAGADRGLSEFWVAIN